MLTCLLTGHSLKGRNAHAHNAHSTGVHLSVICLVYFGLGGVILSFSGVRGRGALGFGLSAARRALSLSSPARADRDRVGHVIYTLDVRRFISGAVPRAIISIISGSALRLAAPPCSMPHQCTTATTCLAWLHSRSVLSAQGGMPLYVLSCPYMPAHLCLSHRLQSLQCLAVVLSFSVLTSSAFHWTYSAWLHSLNAQIRSMRGPGPMCRMPEG